MNAAKRGDIFHRYFSTTKPPKYKFFVIIGEDEDKYVGYFFINSNINDYIRRNDEMFNMQMPIKPNDYEFLDHLSFIDAHELSILKKSDLIKELSVGTTQMKGHLNADDLDRLLDAALVSPLFSEREKDYFR